MTVTLWHNPRCSKSRQTLELLKSRGIDPAIREYLKEPPSEAEVGKLIALVGGDAKELIRDGEPEFKKLGKKNKAEFNAADVAKAIARHPILLQRPIVVVGGAEGGGRAAIGRPPEAVLSLLR